MGFLWRSKRDLNSRAGFPTYALSRGIESVKNRFVTVHLQKGAVIMQEYLILQSEASQLLNALGLSPTRDPYWYMLSIIDVLQEHPNLLAATRKILYPMIAEKHGVGTAAVESAVRRAMHTAKKSAVLPLPDKATAADFLAAVMQELAHRAVTID